MSVQTPNMLLIQPTIGVDSGLTWEQAANANSAIIDGHNHTSGYGVQIPPAGLNINSDLTFLDNNATNLRSVRFFPQASPLALSTDLGCLYESGVDLYYNDGSGNQIQLTAAGNVNATTSGIASGTATASFISSVLVVNAAASTPANIQVGSILLGNNVSGSKFLTLAPPSAMAANYTLTLPSIPASTLFMTLDSGGNMGTASSIAGTQIAAGSITGSQIASATIATANIQDGAITAAKLAANILPTGQSQVFTSTGTFTTPADCTAIVVTGRGGSGGGGGGNNSAGNGQGGGGGGVMSQTIVIPVTASTAYTVTIGAAGSAGGAGNFALSVAATDGGAGGDTTFGSLLTFKGAAGGTHSNASTPGSGGAGRLANGGGASTAGQNGMFANGGAGPSGGGGGAGDLAGGSGGSSGSTGGAGAAGTSGGGGGGGGAGNGNYGGGGGVGTAGQVTVFYVSAF